MTRLLSALPEFGEGPGVGSETDFFNTLMLCPYIDPTTEFANAAQISNCRLYNRA